MKPTTGLLSLVIFIFFLANAPSVLAHVTTPQHSYTGWHTNYNSAAPHSAMLEWQAAPDQGSKTALKSLAETVCQNYGGTSCVVGGGNCTYDIQVEERDYDLDADICIEFDPNQIGTERFRALWPKTIEDTDCGTEVVDRGEYHDCIDPDEQFAAESDTGCTPEIVTGDTNPCDPVTGNKSQSEVDYQSSAAGVPAFARYYNSRGALKDSANMPPGWRHTYSRVMDELPDRYPQILRIAALDQPKPEGLSGFYHTAQEACEDGWDEYKSTMWGGSLSSATVTYEGGNICSVYSGGYLVASLSIRRGGGRTVHSAPPTVRTISRPNGSSIRFDLSGGVWSNPFSNTSTLEQSGSNWLFTDQNDTVETYDSSGKLISIARRNGQTDTLTYNLSVAQGGDGDSDTLDKVVGAFGHELLFGYDTNGLLETVTTPDGIFTYAVDAEDNLSTVTRPDNSVREYVYEDTDFPHHLSGIIDENNDRFATWDYDVEGRAISSEHAGGKERVQLAFNGNGSTTFTNAIGASSTYSFETHQGRRRLSGITGDACSGCAGGDIKARSYDSDGYLYETTDWNNNVTRTDRNTRGLVETLTQGVGSTEQRTTTMSWHTNFRLPTQISTTKNDTDITYDANGNATQVSITDGSSSRTWAMTYNGDGQVLTVNGPRTGVSDITTFTYNNCSTGSQCGQLASVTNALGHVTAFNTYDSSGRVTKVTGPNGLETSYSYDTDGNVLTVTQTPTVGSTRTTTMTYDDVGQLLTVTTPTGTVLTYTYTAAHYLASVSDNLGNTMTYDYDAMGNLTDEEKRDPLNALRYELDYTYDLSSHVDTVVSIAGTTNLNLDSVGNLTSSTDGNSATTQHVFDALNRLEQTTDAMLGVVDYGYDAHDNPTSVTAANGAVTSFTYDDLDNLLTEVSADRGTITYTYDDAGNRLTATDARGITATYAYDALNRVTSVSYPTAAENVTYGYDNASANGIGRLTSVTDQSGSTTYGYDEFGAVTSVNQSISGIVYLTSYQYDADGRIDSITYPSGRVVSYTRNAIGETIQVTSTKSGVVKTVVSSASYEPFGPLASITHGNGVVFDYERRTDYSVTGVDASGIADQSYGFDNAGNITSIDDPLNRAVDRNISYDALNRLKDEDWINSAQYGATVLADGPLAYWRLGESSGTVMADATANAHDGTYHGGVVLAEPGLVGANDTSLRITNKLGTDYGESPVLTGLAMTGLEFWYQVDDLSAHQNLVATNSATYSQVRVYHRNNGRLIVWTKVGADLWSDTNVTAGEPHHVAVWYDAAADTSYFMIDDVVQQDTYSGNIFSNSADRILLGTYIWNNGLYYGGLTGEFDEVAIYDTPVTQSTFLNRGAGTDTSFAYDANGNRTSFTEDGNITTYGYQSQSNRQTSVAGVTVQRDLSGNLTSDGGTRTYSYNNANRFSSLADGGVTTASYVHNAAGQRTIKTVGSTSTTFVYDLNGHLIAEHDSVGNLIRDYVWLDSMPAAQIDQGEVFSYLHVDHLNTPRFATDDTQTVVWKWESDAFGAAAANDDPDGDSTVTTVNLRFPGQYFDSESGLHYNYFRTYYPYTGRYLESDPIGLEGGLNTYAYANSNPGIFTDPRGLMPPEAYRELFKTARENMSEEEYASFCKEMADGAVISGFILLEILGAYAIGPQAVAATGILGSAGDPVIPTRGKPANLGITPTKAPKQVTPGTKELEGAYMDDLGRVQPWRAHYDQYGRQIGRTDYNAGNKAAGIPETHHSKYEYNSRYPDGIQTDNHLPGEFQP